MINDILTKEEIDKIDPKFFICSIWIGSEDVVAVTGDEIKESFVNDCDEPIDKTKFSNALSWWIEGLSGNSVNICLWSEEFNRFHEILIK